MNGTSIPPGFKIPVAARPPMEPATPPDRRPVEARALEVRRNALHAAVQYAAAGGAETAAEFWNTVATFERYLDSGERGV